MKASDFRRGMLVIVKSKSVISQTLEDFQDKHLLSTEVIRDIDYENDHIYIGSYIFKPWDLIPVIDKPKDKEE